MKKLLLFACTAAFAGLVSAQDCTSLIDNGATEVGLNPYPPVGSYQGVDYNEVNTLVVPRSVDNTLTSQPGDSIDLCAIEILNVVGLPSGYSFEVWAFNANMTSYDVMAQAIDTIHLFSTPTTKACIRLKNPNPPGPTDAGDGLPDRDTATLEIRIAAWADLFGCSSLAGAGGTDTFEVGLCIHDASTIGIEDEMGFGFELGNIYPNPAKDVSYLNFTTPVSGEVTVSITDAVGRNVYNYTGTSVQGKNVFGISTEDFRNGIYIYNVTYNGKTISKKLIISK